MPEGSSSAAPVMRPGPIRFQSDPPSELAANAPSVSSSAAIADLSGSAIPSHPPSPVLGGAIACLLRWKTRAERALFRFASERRVLLALEHAGPAASLTR